MEETAKQHFDTVYREYKEYEAFFKEEAKEVEKQKKEFAEFAQKHPNDTEKLTQRLFEINESPVMYQNDLMKLLLRLQYTYEAYRDIIEIPEEIAQEIKKLSVKNSYTIKDGKPIDIDPVHNDGIRKKVKQQYEQTVKQFIDNQPKQ